MNNEKSQRCEKIIFGNFKGVPRPEIYVYYRGLPLSRPATFEGDRYAFRLPVNLEEKLLAGGLIADFCYSEFPLNEKESKRAESPVSIVLSERYV